MFTTLVAAGVGALAFKLGMDAHRMKGEGKSNADVAVALPGEACRTIGDAFRWCRDKWPWKQQAQQNQQSQQPPQGQQAQQAPESGS